MIAIPGLRYVADYIDPQTQESLLAVVDAGEWRRPLGDRRSQIFGYTYHYTKGVYRIGDLPLWALDVAKRLTTDGLMPDLADQLIVNEYEPGQGLVSHVDAPLFTDTIVGISLASTAVIDFAHVESGATESMLLEPMSAFVMSGEVRHQWKHSIAARTSDHWMGREYPRTRRISLTFRKMLASA